ALTLIATGAPESAQDTTPGLAGGLPCLARRISAPPAIMAAATRVFVADDAEAALAARTELAPGQTIVSLDGACVGPAMLRTPAHEAGGRGVLEREQTIKALTADSEATATRLEAGGQELAAVEEHRQAEHEQCQTLEKSLDTARRQLAHEGAEHQGMRTRNQP